MKKYILVMFIVVSFASYANAEYAIDSSRVIDWVDNAGLDPVGGIPDDWVNCTTAACNTLYGGDVTTATINAAITSAPANSIVRIPSGTYTITGAVSLKSNMILRGAGCTSPWLPNSSSGTTTLVFGSGVYVIVEGSGASTSPSSDTVTISSGYTKGSTSIVVSDASYFTGSGSEYATIYEYPNNTDIIRIGDCGWCGNDTGERVKQQYVKVTNKAGSTLTIDPAIDGNFGSTPYIRKWTPGITMAGVEDLKLDNYSGTGNASWVPSLYFTQALYCWAKNVESYYFRNGQDSNVQLRYSHRCEIRNSYIHDGNNFDAGSNYGIRIKHWNSNHKIENNIIRHTRHSIDFDGGGSGSVVTYNYTDDNYESDAPTGLTADIMPSHGAHPYMCLHEGNYASKINSDLVHGNSSYITLFRNYATGTRSTTYVPTYWKWGFDIYGGSDPATHKYYNLVGNVSGNSSWTSGTAVWTGTDCNAALSINIGFKFNCSGIPGSYYNTSYPTALLHGNYDYVTDGVANWADADHDIADSLYYTSEPSWWCTETPWPPIGPDVSGYINDIPAKRRYDGAACTLGAVTTTTAAITGVIKDWENEVITDKTIYVYGFEISGSGSSAYIVNQIPEDSTTTAAGAFTLDFTDVNPKVVLYLYYGTHKSYTKIAGGEVLTPQ